MLLRPGPSMRVLVLEAMGPGWCWGGGCGSSTSTALRAEYEYEGEGAAREDTRPNSCGTRSGERGLLRPRPSTRVLVLVLLLEAMRAWVVVRWKLRIECRGRELYDPEGGAMGSDLSI